MINKTHPYVEIMMRLDTHQPCDLIHLPSGFKIRPFNNETASAWACIEYAAGEFPSYEAAKAYFNEHFADHPDISKRCFFIENDQNQPVATGMVWWIETYPRLHWIAVDPRYQSLGLGKAMVHHLLTFCQNKHPNAPVYLTTQTKSSRAVALYLKAGFKYLEENPFTGEKLAVAFAQLILKIIAVTETFFKRNAATHPFTVGVVALSGPADQAELTQGIKQLKALGIRVICADNCTRTGPAYLAGSDYERANGYHAMAAHLDVDVIMCTKGGYGTPRLIEQLDLDYLKKHPKPLIGFSDVSFLLNVVTARTNQITYHGPMVCGDFTHDFNLATIDNLFDVLFYEPNMFYSFKDYPEVKTLMPGEATGILIGGNLCLIDVLAHTLNDDYFTDKILLMEDVNEPIYRLDRMLTGLHLKGVLNHIKGFLIGRMDPVNGETSEALETFFKDQLSRYQKPVLYGVPFSHTTPRYTLPIGARVYMDAQEKTLQIIRTDEDSG